MAFTDWSSTPILNADVPGISWHDQPQTSVVVATSARQMMADLVAAGVGGTSDSTTDMINIDVTTIRNGYPLRLLGYYTTGDGGGGWFYWDAASTATADDGLVFQAASGGVGRWLRIVETNIYQAAWWGCKSEIGFDNTPRTQAALDALFTDPVAYCTAATWQALRISDSPQLTAYGWETRTVSALPTAIDQARGIQRLLLGGGGVADRAVVCRKDAAGAFAWVDLF
jgi:hypothetical protein